MREEFYQDICTSLQRDARLGPVPAVRVIGAGRAAEMARGALLCLGKLDDAAHYVISFDTLFVPAGATRAVITAPDLAAARRRHAVKPQASILVLDLSDDALYVTDILRMALITLKKGRSGGIYTEQSLVKAGFERFTPRDDSRALYKGFSDDPECFVFPDALTERFKALQKAELDILIETDRVCRENGIRYSLAGGTLLGAVRNRGFIPWDYDIDIMMSPADFDRFTTLSSAFGDRFFLQTPKTDKGNFFFTKVRMNDTLMTTELTEKLSIHNGIFIDVFRHSYTAKTRPAQCLHRLLTKCVRSLVYNKQNGTPVRGAANSHTPRAIRAMATVLKTVLPMHLLCKLQKSVIDHFKTDTGYMYDGWGQHLSSGAFPSEWFDEYTTLDFEGRSYPVISHYDDYLKYLYGRDYMIPPPVSQRHISHDIVRLKLPLS